MVSGDTLNPAGKAGANTLPMPNFIRRQDSGMLMGNNGRLTGEFLRGGREEPGPAPVRQPL